MRLIFDNEIKFLERELGIAIPSKTAFMDRMIIHAFNKEGEKVKLFKISCNDMVLKLSKDYESNEELKTWDDLIKDNEDRLQEISFKARLEIKRYLRRYKGYSPVVPVSGGKDSAIVHHLVNKEVKGGHYI